MAERFENSSKSATVWEDYRRWASVALAGEVSHAERGLRTLLDLVSEDSLRARIHNDLGVLATLQEQFALAADEFSAAVTNDPAWAVPSTNWDRLPIQYRRRAYAASRRTRIAIISLLFNWPSTGGGTIHTAETARFLTRAGYDVQHLVLSQSEWSVGQITDATDWPITQLEFSADQWHQHEIQKRVRQAVRKFSPDFAILTDSWNFKPRLAEALDGVPYFLRLAAQECLCPLNNVRLLFDTEQQFRSCPKHQLATPSDCAACVHQHNHCSGSLHQAERALAGFHGADYNASLRNSFAEATGVLVVNPLIAELVKPYSKAVHVVPSGFDPARFPWSDAGKPASSEKLQILFAGLVAEPMKGFEVLHAACRELWSQRRDFELLATADPPGSLDEFTTLIGWQSQAELPATIRRADLVVCPTIAEEALGRTAVEAMAAARPIVASRIGGLTFTVLDEATGLLFEPGNPADLARQLGRLLDDPELRERMGTAGHRRFHEHYTWDVIIDQHYRRLFGPTIRQQVEGRL